MKFMSQILENDICYIRNWQQKEFVTKVGFLYSVFSRE